MHFETMLTELRTTLRERVRNGTLTERGLARTIGISQPHMHHVLKGIRALSPQIADRILASLSLTAFDLVHKPELLRYVQKAPAGIEGFSFVRCLAGRLGPGYPWPADIGSLERIPLDNRVLEQMGYPVLVRTGLDLAMAPIFGADDMVLLDQLPAVRLAIDPRCFYVIKASGRGFIRRLRHIGNSLYLVTEATRAYPSAWERLDLDHLPLDQVVRARVTFIPKENEWAANVYPLLHGRPVKPAPPFDAN
jgi:hypothetical protein